MLFYRKYILERKAENDFILLPIKDDRGEKIKI